MTRERAALGPFVTRVFLGGSREITRLAHEVRARIDTIVKKGFEIVVGDANGVDKAIQRYLVDLGYQAVTVFHMAGQCRNNLGSWPIHEVPAPRGARGFDHYATKDRAMAETADYGLMVWDGKSRGTFTNAVNLCRIGKIAVVWVAPVKAFQTVRSRHGLETLAAAGDPEKAATFATALQVDLPAA